MSKIQEAIETMNIMESNYSHIRKSDKEFEAIEAGKSALQDQAEREKGCEGCKIYMALQRYHRSQKQCPDCKGCIRISKDFYRR